MVILWQRSSSSGSGSKYSDFGLLPNEEIVQESKKKIDQVLQILKNCHRSHAWSGGCRWNVHLHFTSGFKFQFPTKVNIKSWSGLMLTHATAISRDFCWPTGRPYFQLSSIPHPWATSRLQAFKAPSQMIEESGTQEKWDDANICEWTIVMCIQCEWAVVMLVSTLRGSPHHPCNAALL